MITCFGNIGTAISSCYDVTVLTVAGRLFLGAINFYMDQLLSTLVSIMTHNDVRLLLLANADSSNNGNLHAAPCTYPTRGCVRHWCVRLGAAVQGVLVLTKWHLVGLCSHVLTRGVFGTVNAPKLWRLIPLCLVPIHVSGAHAAG